MSVNLTQVQEHIASKYYADELIEWVSYPEDGAFAGKAFLRIPGSAIYDGQSGCVRLYLFKPQLVAEGKDLYAEVKIGIGYIPEQGKMTQLKAGEYSEAEKSRWRNLTTGYVDVNQLFDLGYLAPESEQKIRSWILKEAGNDKQLVLNLPKGEEFMALIWDTKVSNAEQASRSGKSIGEAAGLALDCPGFKGAFAQLSGTSLMYSGSGYKRRPFMVAEVRHNGAAHDEI